MRISPLKHAVVVVRAGCVLFFAALGVAAGAAELGSAWRGVSKIHGVVTIEYESWIRGEETTGSEFRESTHVEFTLVRDRTPNLPVNSVIWRGASGRISGAKSRQAWVIPYGSSTMEATIRGAIGDLKDLSLSLDTGTGAWLFGSPSRVRPRYASVTQFFGDDPDIHTVMSDSVDSVLFRGSVEGRPTVTHGTYREQSQLYQLPTRGMLKVASVIFWPEYSDLEVEVTIEGYETWRPLGSIQNPTTAGNSLVARATLKSKDGKSQDLPKVERFRFELSDTSREPGVCMNWPLGAKDDDFDLKFADPSGATIRNDAAQKFFLEWGLVSGGEFDAASMPAGALPTGAFGEISADRQRIELTETAKDGEGRPFADAMIESFDFGARAGLRVTCILEDGREIVGLMRGATGEAELVQLPKREGADWIAEAWRKEKDAPALAASDDNESIEGQPMNGDGFTLYEEYRGWVENGRHLEGDPKRKDFFVLNGIKADAVGGLRLFARASKIRVHGGLLPSEMSTDERLMNGNHRAAPHRVDQHGVWMFNAAGTGIPDAGTTGLTGDDARRAFRPGRVRYVTVEPRNLVNSTFSQAAGMKKYGLTAQEAAFGYDRAVAHELLHAVGVEHHGEWEETATFYFLSANDPNNTSRRVGFTRIRPHIADSDLQKASGYEYSGRELSRTPVVTFLWEDTGGNVAEELAPLYERLLAQERARRAQDPVSEDPGSRSAQFPAYGKSSDYWRNTDLYDQVTRSSEAFTLFVTLCDPQGADSGDELCLMRYYFATAYPAKDRSNTYYLTRPGANRAGRSICRSPAGTGGNAPTHEPQSRFGDARAGRGDCFPQICPNDAIPPR